MRKIRDNVLGTAVMLAMLFFVGTQCVLLSNNIIAEWQLSQAPQTIVKKVATDYGGSAFAYTVGEHHARNGTAIVLNLVFITAIISAISILWSSLRGHMFRKSNITASWIISLALLVAMPLQWKWAKETQVIEAYEQAAAAGKAVLTFVSLPMRFDLYPFLIIGLALTFSMVLRQAIDMKLELDATV